MAQTKERREPMQKCTLSLPVDLVRTAKHLGVDTNRDFQDIVADALRMFLARKGTGR